LSHVGSTPLTVTTPTGTTYDGEIIDPSSIVAVSIIRAGDALLECFSRVAPEAQVGKILIQRDESTKQPVLFYSKLPLLANKHVVLVDPMLATGGSAKAAIQVLLDNGATEERITFFNVLSCPEGIACILTAFPKMRIITGAIDDGLNEKVASNI
jgi:uracil phosphoribosyltransferase